VAAPHLQFRSGRTVGRSGIAGSVPHAFFFDMGEQRSDGLDRAFIEPDPNTHPAQQGWLDRQANTQFAGPFKEKMMPCCHDSADTEPHTCSHDSADCQCAGEAQPSSCCRTDQAADQTLARHQ
jgi:hypothetical protein